MKTLCTLLGLPLLVAGACGRASELEPDRSRDAGSITSEAGSRSNDASETSDASDASETESSSGSADRCGSRSERTPASLSEVRSILRSGLGWNACGGAPSDFCDVENPLLAFYPQEGDTIHEARCVKACPNGASHCPDPASSTTYDAFVGSLESDPDSRVLSLVRDGITRDYSLRFAERADQGVWIVTLVSLQDEPTRHLESVTPTTF